MIVMKYTALVTIAALMYSFFLGARVGVLRGKHGIKAPATTGHPEFERGFRVHQNTNEQLIIFIPLLWLGAQVVGDIWAAAIGTLWICGRIIYARAYMAGGNRGTGMAATALATAALAVISLFGVVRAFL